MRHAFSVVVEHYEYGPTVVATVVHEGDDEGVARNFLFRARHVNHGTIGALVKLSCDGETVETYSTMTQFQLSVPHLLEWARAQGCGRPLLRVDSAPLNPLSGGCVFAVRDEHGVEQGRVQYGRANRPSSTITRGGRTGVLGVDLDWVERIAERPLEKGALS